MTTQYAEEQGFKKKYLAPLIVLMLCAVSLTGAAYAYSTSITGHGAIDGDYYSIDLYKDGSGAAVITGDIDKDSFIVNTVKTVGQNYTANVEAGTLVYEAFVKISTDLADTTRFTLSATADYNAPATGKLYTDVSKDGTQTKGVSITDKLSVVYDSTGKYDDTSAATTSAVDLDKLEGNKTYKVTITIGVQESVFGSFATLDALVKALEDEFKAENVGFLFTLDAAKNA